MTLSAVLRRARVLLGRGGIDRELDEELRFHVDMAVERLRREQGLDPAEARRRALVAFGGVDRFREEARDAWGLRRLEELLADLRYALRTLSRTPGSTLAAVVTLALGIGATTAAFTITSQLIRYSTPFAHADRLVQVWVRDESKIMTAPKAQLVYALRERSRTLEAVEPYAQVEFLQTGSGDASYVIGRRVTASFLSFLGLSPALGRTFTDAEAAPGGPDVALLGWSFWRTRFGGERSVLGRTLTLGGHPYTIVGVMPEALARAPMGAAAEVWVPLRPPADTQQAQEPLSVLARLRPGVQPSDAARELARISADLGGVGWGAREWQPDVERPAHADGRETELLLLSLAMLLVLLIACVNVAQLFLARALGREAELAVRSALGAGRGRLVRQLLVEGLAVAAVAGAGGIALAWAGVRLLLAVRPDAVRFLDSVKPDSTMLAVGVTLTLATPSLFALMPALHGTRGDLAGRVAAGSARSGGRRGQSRFRALLVATEVARSVVLLVPTGLLLRSLDEAAHVDFGFQPHGLVAARVRVPEDRYPGHSQREQLVAALLARARTLPGVTSATLTGSLPPTYDIQFGGLRLGAAPGLIQLASALLASAAVGPDYFTTLHIPLREGRAFSAQEVRTGAPVTILGEALARRLAPGRSALGLTLSDGDGRPWNTVIGVARDVRTSDVVDANLQLYWPITGGRIFRGAWLAVRTSGDPAAATARLRAAIRAVDRDLPVEKIGSVDDLLADEMAAARFATEVLAVFAAIALLLASIGLYGALSYAAEQRTREMGIRMALGAAAADVHRLIVRQGMVPSLLGLLAGIGASLAAARLVASFLFGVSPRDLPTLLTVAVTVSAVALAAVWLPARRATRADPMVALRAE